MNRLDVDSPEQQAEKTVNERYHELQAEVTATVRHRLLSRKMRLDDSDLEEAYCQAWHGVCETIKRGKQISNLTGMLVEITWRRAVDTYRELRPGLQAELDLEEPAIDLDLDAQLDDRIKFRRFIAQVRSRLNQRECEAVSLCVIHGYPRAEAAKLMGLQRRQIEKLMDSSTKKIGGIITGITARGCGSEEWARLMRSYALGLITEDNRDYTRAAEHVAQCAACNRYVNGLRGLAAILPPVLPIGPLAATGHSTSILAYLERLFRASHTAGGRMTGEGALRNGATASGESVRGLAGSLGTATIAKGVAVVVAGAAALTLATRDHKAHTHARQPAPATTQTLPPPSAVASATSLLYSPSATRIATDATHIHIHSRVLTRHTHAPTTDRHRQQRGLSQPAQAPRKMASEGTSSTRTQQSEKTIEGAAAVNKEFGWER